MNASLSLVPAPSPVRPAWTSLAQLAAAIPGAGPLTPLTPITQTTPTTPTTQITPTTQTTPTTRSHLAPLARVLIRPLVLVADEDKMVREIVSHRLRLAGLGVDSVASAAEANDLIGTHAYAAAIVSLSLVGRTGTDLIHDLKRVKLPVLALDKHMDTPKRAQGQDTVRLPLDLTDLAERVRGLIATRSRLRLVAGGTPFNHHRIGA